jgi:hypothetical protein
MMPQIWKRNAGDDASPCWRRLTEAIDGGTHQAEHGGPLPLWSDQWRVRHGIAPDEPVPNKAKVHRLLKSLAQDKLLDPRC